MSLLIRFASQNGRVARTKNYACHSHWTNDNINRMLYNYKSEVKTKKYKQPQGTSMVKGCRNKNDNSGNGNFIYSFKLTANYCGKRLFYRKFTTGYLNKFFVHVVTIDMSTI